MREIFFMKKVKKNVGASTSYLSCILIIAFLISACAGTAITQTSSNMDKTIQTTDQTTEKGDPLKDEISDDQTLECRRIATTGSRFKRKICKTKAQWAREAGVGNKTAGNLQKDADRSYSTNVPVSNNGGSFPGAGVPR